MARVPQASAASTVSQNSSAVGLTIDNVRVESYELVPVRFAKVSKNRAAQYSAGGKSPYADSVVSAREALCYATDHPPLSPNV